MTTVYCKNSPLYRTYNIGKTSKNHTYWQKVEAISSTAIVTAVSRSPATVDQCIEKALETKTIASHGLKDIGRPSSYAFAFVISYNVSSSTPASFGEPFLY